MSEIHYGMHTDVEHLHKFTAEEINHLGHLLADVARANGHRPMYTKYSIFELPDGQWRIEAIMTATDREKLVTVEIWPGL